MNKKQKEVQQAFLDNEKAVLKELEANYRSALDKINNKIAVLQARTDADLQHVIYQIDYQKALKSQIQTVLDQLHNSNFETVSEYLTSSYEDGFIGTLYDLQGQGIPLVFPIDQKQVVAAIQHETKLSESLYSRLGKDTKVLSKQIASEISRGISNAVMYSEMARNISGYAGIAQNKAMRIARTESHRIQCKATADAQWKAKEKGADVVKQWDASLDDKTRDTHRQLDGQIRELDEPFEVAGMTAMQPGGFGIASEDCNCRCALLQRARWALGNEYTKWSPDAPIEISDDGTTQFIKVDANSFTEFKGIYKDIAGQMTMNMERGNASHTALDAKKVTVTDLTEYTINGVTYKVDGKHVIMDNTDHEKEIAKLVSKKLGKNVEMVPRVVFPQGVSTPDYIIDGEKYDLKDPTGSGKNVLYNMVNKKKKQADNFIFDVSKCPLDGNAVNEQVEGIYSSTHTSFVNDIIVIKDGKIKKIYSRKEKRN